MAPPDAARQGPSWMGKMRIRAAMGLLGNLASQAPGTYGFDALRHAREFDVSLEDIRRNRLASETDRGHRAIQSINWFLPHPGHLFGGLQTPLRFASYFKQAKAVRNRFILMSAAPKRRLEKTLVEAFPALQGDEVLTFSRPDDLPGIDEADAAIATYWKTAYPLAKFQGKDRKFYFIQDFEPLFYPAGSSSAQAEATYRFGFFGIASTPHLQEIYRDSYAGRAASFMPCVDTEVFHPLQNRITGKLTVFFYGRPSIARNGFELGAEALRRLKARLGDRVRIVTAGAAWRPQEYGLAGVVENLGVVDRKTWASLCRSADVGLITIFTPVHSYVHLDLMASGCLVVSNDNPGTRWLLEDGRNCLLFPAATPGCIAETLLRALEDRPERERMVSNALDTIRRSHSSWDKAGEKIYSFMCDPLGFTT